MLNHLSSGQRKYVTFDDPLLRELVQKDPGLFLQRFQPPILIDEVQYAPELFPYIKINVDRELVPGKFWLTGSQMFRTMQHASESLAGRVAVFNLFSLSNREISGTKEQLFLPGQYSNNSPLRDINQIFRDIIRGGMPQLRQYPEIDTERYFSSYLQTYLERDIRGLTAIQNEQKFIRFLSVAAARVGHELVYESLARDVDVDLKTVKSWMSLLESSGIVYLLPPYFNNAIKRTIKRPKIIFMDSGLAAYLARWSDAETLLSGALAGSFFENYVISEIIKGYVNKGLETRNRLYYYRDSNQKEIDFLIIQNGTVYPIEIKLSTNPGFGAIKNFGVLENFGLEIGAGSVLCLVDQVVPIDQKNSFVPIHYI